MKYLKPVISPEEWRNSQTLSRAKDYTRIKVNDHTYIVHQDHLVREDFIGLAKNLGIPTVQDAWHRSYDVLGLPYGEAIIHAKELCRKLVRLIRARRRQSICNDCVLF